LVGGRQGRVRTTSDKTMTKKLSKHRIVQANNFNEDILCQLSETNPLSSNNLPMTDKTDKVHPISNSAWREKTGLPETDKDFEVMRLKREVAGLRADKKNLVGKL
jgi:hypothetical protein